MTNLYAVTADVIDPDDVADQAAIDAIHAFAAAPSGPWADHDVTRATVKASRVVFGALSDAVSAATDLSHALAPFPDPRGPQAAANVAAARRAAATNAADTLVLLADQWHIARRRLSYAFTHGDNGRDTGTEAHDLHIGTLIGTINAFSIAASLLNHRLTPEVRTALNELIEAARDLHVMATGARAPQTIDPTNLRPQQADDPTT